MLHIQTILHPTDFSSAADHALAVAHSLARDHQAKLVLLNVTAMVPVLLIPLCDYDLVGVVNEARRQLDALAETHNDLTVETQAVVGEAGDAIVATARDCQADLIVMGTQGRSGVSRLLLGSVAEKVLRHAPCPVLTVKPGTEPHLLHEQSTDLPGRRSRLTNLSLSIVGAEVVTNVFSATNLEDGQLLGLTEFGASAHLVLKMVRHRLPRHNPG